MSDRVRTCALAAPAGAPRLRAAGRRFPNAGVPAAAMLALCALAGPALAPPRPRLLWNASPSSPIGLYVVGPALDLVPGDMAVAWAPSGARRLAAGRHYLPFDVPLVKRVAAAAGTRVCATGSLVLVNGNPVARRLARDRSGRELPWWSGCKRLGPGDLFLLSANWDAFDGRYFGVTRAGEVIGKARLVWPA